MYTHTHITYPIPVLMYDKNVYVYMCEERESLPRKHVPGRSCP